ncbi:hypothetical protein [Pseudoalteromonas luteoviolacea]|nr:hypothetical protein FLM44_13250 [Pseudoalteromonas luteoviolacea]
MAKKLASQFIDLDKYIKKATQVSNTWLFSVNGQLGCLHINL